MNALRLNELPNEVLFYIFANTNDFEKNQLSKVSTLFKTISEDDRLWQARAIQCGKKDEDMSNKEYVKLYSKEYIHFFLSELSDFDIEIQEEDVFAAKNKIDSDIQNLFILILKIQKMPQVVTSRDLRHLRMLIEAKVLSSTHGLNKVLAMTKQHATAEVVSLFIQAGIRPNRHSLSYAITPPRRSQEATRLILQTGLKLHRTNLHEAIIAFGTTMQPVAPLSLETVRAYLDRGVRVDITTLGLAQIYRVSEDIQVALKTAFDARKQTVHLNRTAI